MQRQAWRVSRQGDLVRREPTGQGGLRAQTEMWRHEGSLGGKDREGAVASVLVCLKQVPHQAFDPPHPEPVTMPRALVLIGLPMHKNTKRLWILRVELERCSSHVALEL